MKLVNSDLVIGVRLLSSFFYLEPYLELKLRVVNIIGVSECLVITVAICLEIINWYLSHSKPRKSKASQIEMFTS